MSRSGYSEEYDDDGLGHLWRGAVTRAIRGKRGQSFLKEMLEAMDTIADGKLIADDLEREGAVCAIGTVGKKRGIDMSELDPEDYETIAAKFKIARALAQEIEYMNDEGSFKPETPEARFIRMRTWVESQVKKEPK